MITRAEQDVLDRIDEEFVVAATQRLLRARGENPPGGEAATVAVLRELARELGGLEIVTVEVEPGRENLRIGLPGRAEPGLLILGHTDVVPVGDGWRRDPFGGELAGDRVFGRGASDMKGGLAATLAALAALRGAGLRGPVELAALVDEEETGKGIRSYLPTVGPSTFGACITAEPTALRTIVAARGDSYLQVVVHGRAAHAGNPDGGANAIYGAAAIVAEIQRLHHELAAHPHPLLGPATWSVGQIQGGTGGSIVPAECTIVADRRLLPGESPTAVLTSLRERLDRIDLGEVRYELAMPMEMPAFETPADAPLVQLAHQSVRDAGGPDLPPAGWTAACDGGFVARDLGLPTIVLGPGSVTTQAHRPDESVPVGDLVTAARAYTLTALRLLGG